jgi:hypothetical protein
MSKAREMLMYVPAAVLVPTGALGVAALFDTGPRLLRRHKTLAGLLAAGAAAGLVKWQLDRVFTEQPEYEVERTYDGFEIRRYQPRAVAETTVDSAGWEAALDEGFRRLAGYIFGGNLGKQTLAMTTPVNASAAAPEKPAMTTPVTARPESQGVTVTFTMPRTRDVASLPTPTDGRVRLREQDGQRVAALRFRGTYGRKRKLQMEAKLLRLVQDARLITVGPPVFAGYDAPSTLPFLRRVEIWVPIV